MTGSQTRDAAQTRPPWRGRSQPLLAAAAVVLLVAAVLIPSESAVRLGTHVVLIMAWFLLAALTLLGRLTTPRPRCPVGATEPALALFLLGYGASALVMLRTGHARPTLNAIWMWMAFGMLFLSVRQLFRHPLEQRALVSAVIALATGLSVFGLYQVGYSNPRMQAEYERDPEAALRAAGVDAPHGSPERQHFKDRLYSKEPIGPFELTNSLAGLLAPGLVLLLSVATSFRPGSPRGGWPLRFALILSGVLVTSCLLLTKSRSAYGAVLVGMTLLAFSRAIPRRWIRKSVLLSVLGALIVLTAAAAGLGGLDREVITEAPKSLAVRLEYWRATGAMIADHPWFGCGPGNFQSCYTRYKVPAASEEVADPHNLLMEVAATAGVPVLVLFLLIPVALARDLGSRRRHGTRAGNASTQAAPGPVPAGHAAGPGAVYAGVVAGFVLAYPAGWAGGFPPRWDLFWVGCPATVGMLWVLHRWVTHGTLHSGPLVVAGITLCVNLLAAGGIGFPGVGQSAWLLAALALNVRDSGDQRIPAESESRRDAWWTFAALLAVVGLAGACFLTMYRPILAARQELDKAHEAVSKAVADRALERAAAADPWWADPWEMRAELESELWIANGSDSQLALFFAARDGLLERNPSSSQVYRRCGNWLLEMYAVSGRADLGEQAVEAYGTAVRLYPCSGILRAQLAWACHVTGADQLAREQAEEALRLDALNPHLELKLARQRVVGDYLDASGPADGGERPMETAEQLMQRVRSATSR